MKPSQLRARYWRIVLFFGRMILGFVLWEIIMPRVGMGALSRRNRPERNRRTAARFRAFAASMGGLMIKVGQFLSTRLDVLPPEITEELAGLQDEVAPEPFAAIRALAEAELAQPLLVHYAWFDEAPVAAASLGQAHRARLNDEDATALGFADVIVKVQRPGISDIVEVDLAAIRRVGGWLERYKPVSRRADVKALIEEFATTTRAEIDYLAEAGNAERFSELFAEHPRVHVPRVVWDLTARRVLTLEDVTAIKLGDYEGITAAGIDRAEVAAVLFDTYLQQIFDDGFFHADPHPGNLFITPLDETHENGSRAWRLTFIDFGMMGLVPENLKAGLREGVIAIGLQDGARLVAALKTLDVLLPGADTEMIERASMQLFDRFGGMDMDDLRNMDHTEMMSFGLQFRDLMLDLPFQLPGNLLLLGRTVAILSGMCSGLDPDFNMWSAIAPYATRLISDEEQSTWQTLLTEGTKVLKTTIGLPARADRVMSLVERGELSVRTPLLDLRVRRVERGIRGVASALVFAALLLAGAILYGTEPTLAKWLMGASVLPLLTVMTGGRKRYPGM
ncbi:MAG: AarF/UbiB family protein [Coriobacteriia bacterium]|nr:AarF/UbiB family protein [Coriobacteriia bacterium]